MQLFPRSKTKCNETRSATPAARFRRATLAGVLLAGTALGGFAAGHITLAATTAAQPVNPPAAQPQRQIIPSFVDLVKQVKPAVVSVTVKFAAADASDQGPQQSPQQMPFPFNQFPFNQVDRRVKASRSKPAAPASSSMPTARSSPTTMW